MFALVETLLHSLLWNAWFLKPTGSLYSMAGESTERENFWWCHFSWLIWITILVLQVNVRFHKASIYPLKCLSNSQKWQLKNKEVLFFFPSCLSFPKLSFLHYKTGITRSQLSFRWLVLWNPFVLDF